MAIRIAGLYALIPASVLLTICFFVLFSSKKCECPHLKIFGQIVACLLIVSALLILAIGAQATLLGKDPVILPTIKYMLHVKSQLLKEIFGANIATNL